MSNFFQRLTCENGFKVNWNGSKCVDIDECDLTPTTIPADGVCKQSEDCTTWDSAMDACNDIGGSIWAPKNKADFDWLQSLDGDYYLGNVIKVCDSRKKYFSKIMPMMSTSFFRESVSFVPIWVQKKVIKGYIIYHIVPWWVQEKVNLLLYPNWSD